MKKSIKPILLLFLIVIIHILVITLGGNSMADQKYNKLTPEEEWIIVHKGTEIPFTGKYYKFNEKGIYHCRRCGAPLYRSEDKFDAGCGWPSFDDEIPGAIKRQKETDGVRTEILCARCGAHLGHIFEGEGLTPKDVRHCVNSISLTFTPYREEKRDMKKAYFAGGCFWGVEYLFEKKKGVIDVVSGYMGGKKKNPTYEEVCSHTTGHREVVEVTYNPEEVSYEELAKYFFEIHDPTQTDGQGPDIGEQYKSTIFFNDEYEKDIAQKLIDILKKKGYNVSTELLPAQEFYRAEDYHQDYYTKHKKEPYCHIYRKRF